LGGDRIYAAVPWFWPDQYDPSLQVAGLSTAAVTEVVRSRPDGVDIRYGIDDAGRLVSVAAVGPGNAVAKDVRLAEMAIGKRVVAQGFTDEDVTKPGSDRLVDSVVAYGTADQIAQRLQEHVAAGADHVAVQVVEAEQLLPVLGGWQARHPVWMSPPRPTNQQSALTICRSTQSFALTRPRVPRSSLSARVR
jgi:hypothetical protein